jgi:succinate dehydrogenase/fumarate reductase cytochrome b subunit
MKTQDDIDAFNKRNRIQDDIAFIESHPLISRVEVIGEGREFVKHGINGIRISFQDDGKTLKVFIDG